MAVGPMCMQADRRQEEKGAARRAVIVELERRGRPHHRVPGYRYRSKGVKCTVSCSCSRGEGKVHDFGVGSKSGVMGQAEVFHANLAAGATTQGS